MLIIIITINTLSSSVPFELDDDIKKIIKDTYELLKSEPKLSKHQTAEGHITSYRVNCENCSASGPPTLHSEGAADFWNKSTPRPNPLDEAIKKDQ
jgi:hypothetical protein